MGGKNPYLNHDDPPLPDRKYKVTFLPMNVTIEVDPAALPFGRDGLPGSLLDTALSHGIELDHACGGVCACSTCHCIVRKGLQSMPPSTEAEDDMLELAPGVSPNSRLACQAVPDGSCDLVVEIPGWNRNLARETPH